jgi:hypothetical protein
MARGLKIEFAFVPMPLEAFDPENPLREAGLRLLAYILKHTRFGEAFPEVTYEELLNGITDERGRRKDHGCGLSRNGIKNGQAELEERGWLEAKNLSTDKSRPRWKYRLILGDREVSPSDNALSRNDSVTKEQVISRSDNALSPSDSGTVTKCEVLSPNDRCNKEEESTKNLDKELEKAGDGKRPRLSQPERDTWDLRRWRKAMEDSSPQTGSREHFLEGEERARFYLQRQRDAAYVAGISLTRLQQLLKQFFPDDDSIDKLVPETPLLKAAESEEEIRRTIERSMPALSRETA